jgi:hypothetical protein
MEYNKNLLTAIICIKPPGEKPLFLKYRNVKNATYQLNKLIEFAKTKSFASHINLYWKKDRSFYQQIKLHDTVQPKEKKADDNKRMF